VQLARCARPRDPGAVGQRGPASTARNCTRRPPTAHASRDASRVVALPAPTRAIDQRAADQARRPHWLGGGPAADNATDCRPRPPTRVHRPAGVVLRTRFRHQRPSSPAGRSDAAYHSRMSSIAASTAMERSSDEPIGSARRESARKFMPQGADQRQRREDRRDDGQYAHDLVGAMLVAEKCSAPRSTESPAAGVTDTARCARSHRRHESSSIALRLGRRIQIIVAAIPGSHRAVLAQVLQLAKLDARVEQRRPVPRTAAAVRSSRCQRSSRSVNAGAARR